MGLLSLPHCPGWQISAGMHLQSASMPAFLIQPISGPPLAVVRDTAALLVCLAGRCPIPGSWGAGLLPVGLLALLVVR